MSTLDLRPGRLDIVYRPGNELLLELTWPDGSTAGHTYTAFLGATELDIDVAGDVVTVTADGAITTAMPRPRSWTLLQDDEVVITGSATPSVTGTTSPDDTVTVTFGTNEISVVTRTGVLHAALGDTDTDGHPASVVTVTPTGGLAGTNVQAALAELDTEATETAARLAVKAGNAAAELLGGNLKGWDNFHRTDRLLNGDTAQSGQVFFTGGGQSNLPLVNNRHRPIDTLPGAKVLYLPHRTVMDAVAAEFVFTPGTTRTQNAVIGACRNFFGASVSPGGSVQLAVYADHQLGQTYEWALFYVEDPVVDPYPIIASGMLNIDMVDDGETRYVMAMRRTGEDTVTIELPDGQVLTYINAAIATYWGNNAGFQIRPAQVTDGWGEFTAIATAGPTVNQVIASGAALYSPGDGTSWLQATAPTAWDLGDVDVRWVGFPASLSSGQDQGLVSQWSAGSGIRAVSLELEATGKLKLRVSLDGITESVAISSVLLPFVTGAECAAMAHRDKTTGDVTFYTSTDRFATRSQLGSVVATTPGALVVSDQPIKIGQRTTGADNAFTGYTLLAQIRDSLDGDIIAEVDTTAAWENIDEAGNVWSLQGEAGWHLIPASVDGLTATLAGLSTADGLKLAKASNLLDLADAATARTNLGLGTAATHDFGLIVANTQTDNYVLVLSDVGKVIEMNKATANTLTIPLNATVAFPIGTVIEVYQMGAGQVTIAAAGGVTLRTPRGAKLAAQYCTASLRKRDTDTWVVSGDTTT